MTRLKGMLRLNLEDFFMGSDKTFASKIIDIMLHCMLSTTCKVTTEAALGLIGGTMGLLNGFSILSGVEIIYYLLRFYIEHLSLSNKHLSNKHLSNKHLLNQCFILPHHSHCNCLIFLPIIYIHRICILVP